MNDLPLVSVAIPAYNAQRFVAQAIESMLAQSYTNFELLIQDDCSTDDTLKIIESFDDPRIKLEQNSVNMGVGATRNALMNRAIGKYLAVMDADDLSVKCRLKQQVDFMENNPDISIYGSFLSVIDENGLSKGSQYCYPIDHEQIKALLLFTAPIGNPSAFFRLSSIRQSGLQYDQTCVADDMIFWGDAIDKVQFANSSEFLVNYRVWSTQMTSTRRQEQINDSFKVAHKRMNILGIELSDSEQDIYKRVVFEDLPFTEYDLKIFREILFRIWQANELLKIHDRRALRSTLTIRYKQVCKSIFPHLKSKFEQLRMLLLMR